MQEATVNRAAIYVKANRRQFPGSADAETQMLESEDFCRQIGLEVTVRYSDEVGSREEFKRMMADASGGQAPFDHVVVWKPVCFALQLEEAILEKEKLTAHGIKLLAVKHKTLDD